ncbi:MULTISPECIES: ABC transporter substrate-binding protein [Alphaproteobacteria]|jgi:peptide/nickel transport system substrate-binding protein|uniref:ABC transporter substrate-binding protein n=1 Tax=Alphaproteobacteria TaxID=28211 RepID=UPI000A3B6AB1|nr:ABC transporter substrate-binding protein [Oceanibaculum nanhaiense]MBC7134699.1 ABC transporter substrate-binding protein [Oceanibaculum nanhaiense]
MQFPFLSRRAALALGLSLTTTLSVAALMAPGAARADDRPVVRVAVQQVVNSGALTPLREQSNVGARVFPMIFSPLIDLDRQGDLAPVPGLAESWKRIDDKTVELKLRQGATFHNGDEVTAEDVAFSFGKERMFGDKPPRRAGQDDKTIKSDDSKTLFTTTNTQAGPELPPEVPAIARRLWPSLERVEVVDKYTVRFVNAVPDVTMEGRLARMGSQIISKRAFLEAKDWMSWARNPISAGPFKIKEFRPDNVLVLEAHDSYFNGKPTVKEIRYVVVPEVPGRVNGLLSGEYDFASDIPPDQIATIEANDKFEVVGGPVLNHRLIVFDKNHPQLADARIRQALTHAMDRQAIVDALWGGRTSVPAGLQWEYYADMFHADWKVPEYNPELAKKLVKESGYKGEPIPFRVTNNYYTNQVQTAQILTEMWRSVGLNVEIQMKENWQQIFDRNDPRAIRDWSNSAPFSDPVSSIVNQHGPNGQQQQVGEWSNEEFNKLSGVLETSTNHEERRKAFRRMLEIAEREDPAYTVLHRNVVFYGKRKDIEWKWSPTFAMDFRADNIRYKK